MGATNRAVYDVYLEYCDETEPAGEKLIEYDKLKKLCRHLVRSSDRSMLVLKNAPEKIYTLTTAAVILRAILKHFGVANIVVSDFGVKEGYLALAAGKRRGSFPRSTRSSRPRPPFMRKKRKRIKNLRRLRSKREKTAGNRPRSRKKKTVKNQPPLRKKKRIKSHRRKGKRK